MFSATRKSGLQLMHLFLPNAGRAYAATRNSDFGPDGRNNVSSLSPWVKHRLLREEEIVRETLKRHAFKSAEKFIQEVFWRAYFKGWLEQRPDVWTWYKKDLTQQLSCLENNSELKNRYEDAVLGATGIECFDYWTNELRETGYLHNHARMWFASIWIFTLELPWVLGADFFYRHLLDGDPASNTCSWRWVAGLHTKGKHYVARASNIEKFTNGRFNPQGQLNETPVTLTETREAKLITPPQTMEPPGDDYILLVHEDDCSPEAFAFEQKPSAVMGISETAKRSPLGTSCAVNEFSTNAVRDGLSRASLSFECPTFDKVQEDSILALIEVCEDVGTKTVRSPYMPVGPLADKFRDDQSVLNEVGINIIQHVDPYDAVCWPHATRGFFKLKEKIPKITNELRLL